VLETGARIGYEEEDGGSEFDREDTNGTEKILVTLRIKSLFFY